MDKFVTKTSRSIQKSHEKIPVPKVKQATLESLQGVVVIEDIKRLKTKLQLPDQPANVLLESLHELSQKVPPKHVLKSTKIGHAVYKLRKHSDEAVAKAAEALYKKWIKHFEEFQDRPQIEVRSDPKSERMRDNGRKFLAESLSLPKTDTLVDAVEREVFHQSKRLVGVSYRKTMRALVFKLKHSEDVRSHLLNKSLSVEELVKRFKK